MMQFERIAGDDVRDEPEPSGTGKDRAEQPAIGTVPGPEVLAPEAPGQRRVNQVMALQATIGRRHEGSTCRKVVSAAWGGKPLKGKPHRRYRHEIRPDGFREEQSVKRLRKPAGAAQPGEASPVWVASRCLKRHRGTNLMRGVASATVHRGSYSGAELKFTRGCDGVSRT